MRGTAEDEDPVHLGQSAQLHLMQRSGALSQPKVFSTSQRAYAERRVVLRSTREWRALSFFYTCTVTFNSRSVATKSWES